MADLIDRQAVVDLICDKHIGGKDGVANALPNTYGADLREIIEQIDSLPSARLEPLTDKEQRIFLAAMAREEKVCEEVDRNYVREPYEDSLMRVCKEIRRKVKGALWT